MATFSQLDDSSNIWLLVFAIMFYVMALFSLFRFGNPRVRAEMTVFQGYGKTTYIVCVLTYFAWGSVYLGRVLGWDFVERYHLAIQIGSVAACAVCFGIDWLRANLPRRF